jgi:uridine kinase
MAKIKYVIKRNGATVPFSQDRITNAIYRTAVDVRGQHPVQVEGCARVAEVGRMHGLIFL